jgi:branched-chain amino acid transport system permease protein
VPNLLPSDNLLAGSGVLMTWQDLFVIGVSGVVMVGLYLFVKLSRLGKAMRATAQNPTAARLMGIDVNRVIGATFAIGGALAGVASVVYGLYVHTIHYQMGYQNGLYAFTAAVLGGIGSIPGAVIGGLIIGIVRAFSDQYIGAQWQPAVVFGMLILLLVFRPTGLLGSTAREKV